MTIKENFEEFHNAASMAINLFIRLALTIAICSCRGLANGLDVLREMTYTQVEEVYASRGIDTETQTGMMILQNEAIISDKDLPNTIGYGFAPIVDSEFNMYSRRAMEGV